MRRFSVVVGVLLCLASCGDKFDGYIKKLDGFKDSICECDDGACAAKVVHEQNEWMQSQFHNQKKMWDEADKEQPSDAQKKRVYNVHQEAAECSAALGFKDRVCACEDEACADTEMQQQGNGVPHLVGADEKPTEAQTKRLDTIDEKARVCREAIAKKMSASCKEVISKWVAVQAAPNPAEVKKLTPDPNFWPQVEGIWTSHCIADHWSAESLACFRSFTSDPKPEHAEDKCLTPDQHAKMQAEDNKLAQQIQARSDPQPKPVVSDYDRLITDGNKAFGYKQYDSALTSYEAALKLLPSSEPALWGIAEVYRLHQDKPKAIDAYQKYLAAYPDSKKAKDQLAQLRTNEASP